MLSAFTRTAPPERVSPNPADDSRRGLRTTVIAGLAALSFCWFSALPAEAQQRPQPLTQPVVSLQPDLRAGEMVVPVNKSQVLRTERAFTDLSIGNPEVADVVALSDRSVYVLGKTIGSTNLAIYGKGRELVAVVDVVVSHDVEGLKTKLYELMPKERIEVRAASDSLVLSGIVSTPEQLARALSIAERYAPGKVSNLLRVRGSQQVMVQVKVAEVSRTVARELGLKPELFGGDFAYSTLDPLDLDRFGAGLVQLTTSEFGINGFIDALEEKGVVKVLAEPNLVALSGDTATFLAGGEFPVPVGSDKQDGITEITIEFKPFGVSLAFTPTVIDGDLINLVVSPEVSKIDPSASIVLNSITIPGLSTRRATTTIELRDGQSFAIAGLLQSDFTDQVRQLPGVGDIPVLGALFRSAEFERRETELVIIVTPRLVKPVSPDALAAPTDYFQAPSDFELFALGWSEGMGSGSRQVAAADAQKPQAVLGAQAGGGLSGPYGHIIK